WTREEDITHDKARPFNVSRFTAALGDDGLPAAWTTRCVGEPNRPTDADRAIRDMVYQVPNRRHERHIVYSHIPTTTHRAPAACQNGFMIEQFVDEVALAGDWDPLEWRLEMTRHRPDWQRVLSTLKDKSGFTTELPRGEGMGIGVVESHGTIVAACATVSVSRRGQLYVDKVVLVVDSGHVINPLGATEQLEGGVCWELSHAWLGGLDLRDGRFVNTNFDSYKLMGIQQMPEVEVHFALSGGDKWGGIGEPGGPPTPPAVANAIYFATGKRVRSTPFIGHDLSWS
ncbi:MAG: molybdopterin-dependent oxidoreductase, partial [Gammaproteobacteria bacterium]|nr:molybdopterin-dependent oxidoreductase [Gammaproteobacteria bacterium]